MHRHRLLLIAVDTFPFKTPVRNDRIAIETEPHLCIKALFFKSRRISTGSLTIPI